MNTSTIQYLLLCPIFWCVVSTVWSFRGRYLCCFIYWIAFYNAVICVRATAKQAIRSSVLSPPGLLTSEDGSSHLDLQLSISCLCKRPNSHWSCDATFAALLQTQWDLSLLSFCSLLLVRVNLENTVGKGSEFEVLCSYLCTPLFIFFITFLKLKMYWFFSDVVISSWQKSISMAQATCCYCHCIFPLKSRLSFPINGSLIIEAAQVDEMHVLSCLPDELPVARMLSI